MAEDKTSATPSAHAIRHATRVRELSRLSRTALRNVEAKRIADAGMRRVYGGPGTKDELIASILEFEGLDLVVSS